MSPDRRESDCLDRDERAFVERLAASYGPRPLTPAQRAAFDVGLEKKLLRRRRRVALAPLLAGATAAAALVWALLPGGGGSGVDAAGGRIADAAAAQWEYELLFPADAVQPAATSDEDLLPDDYAAIAGLLLDG